MENDRIIYYQILSSMIEHFHPGLLRKNAFLSITWVPAIRMKHARASSKGHSTRNVFCIGSHLRLLLNPAKVPNFQYRAWLCSMDQKFHGNDEKTRKSRFWDFVQWPMAKVQKFKYKAWWYSIDRKFHADDK
jgi:hypothetical protein